MQIPAAFGAGAFHLAQAEVPSGQPIELFEVLIDQVGTEAWLRFRFHAPHIGRGEGDITFDQSEADFMVLCQAVAIPYMREFDLVADKVVVSLSNQPIEFGQSDPDVTQFIEAFQVANDSCIWDGF